MCVLGDFGTSVKLYYVITIQPPIALISNAVLVHICTRLYECREFVLCSYDTKIFMIVSRDLELEVQGVCCGNTLQRRLLSVQFCWLPWIPSNRKVTTLILYDMQLWPVVLADRSCSLKRTLQQILNWSDSFQFFSSIFCLFIVENENICFYRLL